MAKYDENSSRFKEMAKMVGAFVSAVRETGKAPVVSVLYKQTLNRSCAPETARKFKAVMASVVAAIYNDGSAKLYRENRTSKELVPIVLDTWKTIKVPSARKYTKHEKPAASPACFTEDLFNEASKQENTRTLPEYEQPLVRPDQLTDAELDERIAELQATLNAFVFEKNKRAEIVAKKRELFKTVSELVEGEGFTLEEIMDIV